MAGWSAREPQSLLNNEQILALREAEKEASDHSRRYDKELRNCKALRAEIEAERSAVSSYHKSCSRMISSNLLRQIPPEVLKRIFVLSCLANSDSCCLLERKHRKALQLSVVSKRWRAAALSVPEIWADITLFAHNTLEGFRYDRARVLDEALEVVKLYIDRSMEEPLNILIGYSGEDAGIVQRIHSVISMMTVHSKRWRTCSFAVDSPGPWPSHQLNYPLLESITLGKYNRIIFPPPPDHPALTPRLRRLRLGHSSGFGIASHLDLTHVTIFEWYAAEIAAEALQRFCNRLPSLQVLDVYIWRAMGTSTTSVPLPASITTLKLKVRSSSCVATTLGRILLPNLTRLEFECQRDNNSSFTDTILSFISLSQCSISVLVLQTLQKLSDRCLLEILQCMPELQSLTISEGGKDNVRSIFPTITEHLFTSLATTSALVPSLTKAHFDTRRLYSQERDLLVLSFERMKESRAHAEITIQCWLRSEGPPGSVSFAIPKHNNGSFQPSISPHSRTLEPHLHKDTITLCPRCSYSLHTTKLVFPPSTLAGCDPNNANSMLTSDQINAYREAQREATVEMEIYDSERARLDSLCHGLFTERSALKKYRQECQLVLSNNVLRQVPPEILGEIFTFACSNTSFCCLAEPENRTALRLAVVCSRWRAVALDNSHIWAVARIVGHVSEWDGDPDTLGAALEEEASMLEVGVEILAVYLARSRHVPLDVTVRLNSSSRRRTPRINEITESLESALLAHSRRWRSAELHVGSLDHWLAPRPALPTLETLKISKDFPFPIQDEHPLPLPLPSLRSLHIGASQQALAQIGNHLDLRHVTKLSVAMRRISIESLIQLCQQLPELTDLEVYGIDLGEPPRGEGTLMGVKTLNLDLRTSQFLRMMLGILTVPNLVRLDLGCSFFIESRHLIGLLQRSRCQSSLTDLRLIKLHRLRDTELIAILQNTPSLQFLALLENKQTMTPTLTQEFFAALSSASPVIIPMIRELYLECRSMRNEESTLLRFAAKELKRSRPSVRITTEWSERN